MSEPAVRVLLGSGGISTEDRREVYRNLVGDHFSDSDTVLFVPYASDDHDAYTSKMQDFMGPNGPSLVGIHTFEDERSAVDEAEGIYVGGGNSFLLIRDLHERGLIGPIRESCLGGVPYLGVSAGSNVACPTMMTTNDMPIVLPPSFESFGIVPFQINPHYLDPIPDLAHMGETRPQRIREYLEENHRPVLGLREGSWLEVDGDSLRLGGDRPARLFVRGEEE